MIEDHYEVKCLLDELGDPALVDAVLYMRGWSDERIQKAFGDYYAGY